MAILQQQRPETRNHSGIFQGVAENLLAGKSLTCFSNLAPYRSGEVRRDFVPCDEEQRPENNDGAFFGRAGWWLVHFVGSPGSSRPPQFSFF
jgi:hypothetical protein